MSARTATRAGWSIVALALSCVAAAFVLVALRGSHVLPGELDAGPRDLLSVALLAIGFSVFGALIVARHPTQPIGWLFCMAGVGGALTAFLAEYAARGLIVEPGSLPFAEAAAWIRSWIWIATIPVIGTVLPLLFPTGRLPSPRWRPVLWLAVVFLVVLFAWFGLGRGPLGDFGIENPLGILPRGLVESIGVPFALIIPISVSSLVFRFRRAQADERQQLRWVAAAAVFFLAASAIEWSLTDIVGEREWLGWQRDGAVGIALLVTGAAILKYRIYELDLLVNRTLVYGALTASVIAIYVGIVGGLGVLLDSRGLGVSLAATVTVAIAVQPFRLGLQRRIDRLMYGDRDNPYRALARFGERLEGALALDAVMPAIAESVAEGLRVPGTAIEIDQRGAPVTLAAHGEPRGGEPVRLPLEHRGEHVGRLVVFPRSPTEPLSARDLRLLADLARQAGATAHAARLTADLRRSRERLLAARDEERRRLRRDLHDGLGPMLAGVGLEIESTRALLETDPETGRAMLSRLPGEIADGIADIRRIVHDLRPPRLDELGLLGAVRAQAARIDGSSAGGQRTGATPRAPLRVSVEGPPELPPLPAAVEVAAYRIVLEALTNVCRHAAARSCSVKLGVNGSLEVVVSDDGQGLPADPSAGVGLASMRERAEELGGTLALEPSAPRGTVVRARLPLERRGGSSGHRRRDGAELVGVRE